MSHSWECYELDPVCILCNQDWFVEELANFLDTSTMMTCRLVCSLWNLEFQQRLAKRNKKRGHTVNARLKTGENEENLKYRLESENKTLSTVVNQSNWACFGQSIKLSDFDRRTPQFANTILSGLEEIVKIITIDSSIIDMNILPIIGNLSRSLRKVYMSEVEVFPELLTTFHTDATNAEYLTPTAIEAFSLELAEFQEEGWKDMCHETISRIVQLICISSPELKYLKSPYFKVMKDNHVPMGSRDTDFPVLAKLEHLILSCSCFSIEYDNLYPFNHLNKISNCWNLKTLELSNVRDEHSEGLELFLTTQKKSLRNLTVKTSQTWINSIEIKFPLMDNLTELVLMTQHALPLSSLSDIIKLQNLKVFILGCNRHPYDCSLGYSNNPSCLEKLFYTLTSKAQNVNVNTLQLLGFFKQSVSAIVKIHVAFPNLETLEIGINSNDDNEYRRNIFYTSAFRAIAKNLNLKRLIVNLTSPGWSNKKFGANDVQYQISVFECFNPLQKLQHLVIETEELDDISTPLIKLSKMSHVTLQLVQNYDKNIDKMREILDKNGIFLKWSKKSLLFNRRDFDCCNHSDF